MDIAGIDAHRSELMRRIRRENTRPELLVRGILFRLGYRFRLHRKELPGSPDIVFPGRRSVIFVHGCYWHGHVGCAKATVPKTRTDFWLRKFERNARRDLEKTAKLEQDGWRVLVVWECELKDTHRLTAKLTDFLGPHGQAKPPQKAT